MAKASNLVRSVAGSEATLAALRDLLDAGEDPRTQELAFDAATRTVFEAGVSGERDLLQGALDSLALVQARYAGVSDPSAVQSEILGRIRGLLTLALIALERVPSSETIEAVGFNTHAHRFLVKLRSAGALRSGQLVEELSTEPQEVSRTG